MNDGAPMVPWAWPLNNALAPDPVDAACVTVRADNNNNATQQLVGTADLFLFRHFPIS